jgi:hypothetical protein
VRYDFDSLANLTAGLCPLVGSEEAMALQGRGMTGQRCASHLTTYAACIAAGLPVFVSEVLLGMRLFASARSTARARGSSSGTRETI